MSVLCIMVASISGIWCAADAEPVEGWNCHSTWFGTHCVVDDLPFFLSTYDPDECEEHPTNCSDPSDPWHGAVSRLSPNDYGTVAACPVDWLWDTITIPDIPLTVSCEDTGGRIHPTYRQIWVFDDGPARTEWAWVVVIDVLNDHSADPWPWWSLQAWDGYHNG